jgi:hypothetical protein
VGVAVGVGSAVVSLAVVCFFDCVVLFAIFVLFVLSALLA